MKVTIQKKALAALAESASAVADGKMMISLGMVVLRAEAGRLHVSATDAYSSLRARAECAIQDEGVVGVDARALHATVSKLPDGEVKLEYDAKAERIVVKAARSSYRIGTIPADDQPAIPELPESGWVSMPSASLRASIDAVACAAGTDTSRPHMMGILLRVGAAELLTAATDGHRLHVRSAEREGATLEDVILPPKAILLLRAMVDGDVELAVKNGTIHARQGTKVIGVKLAGEVFPPFSKVIPAPTPKPARVKREELLDALKRLGSVGASAIDLRVEPNTIVIASETMDGNKSGTEEVPADSIAQGPKIRGEGRYLIEAVSRAGGDEIELHTGEVLDPIVIRSEGYVGCVMPMRQT
jgi:DNA polymerase-3 subunit beta